MRIERFGWKLEKGVKEQQSVLQAKVIDARFHLIRKLGITSNSERELALLHLQLRVLRYQFHEANQIIRNPIISLFPNLQYSAGVIKKAEQRDSLRGRMAEVSEEIDARQTAMYKATPGTSRPRTIELAINIFMSGGESYVARNMGTKFFRRRDDVSKWKRYWREELNTTE